MKKGCLIAAGVFVVFVAVIIGVAMLATGGVVKAADEFFTRVREGKVQEAYETTSAGFKRETDADGFQRFVKRYALDQVASWSWSSRSFQNNQGHLEGTLTLKSGATMTFKVGLVHENDAWKIHGLEGEPPPGVVVKEPAPAEEDLKRLVRTTLLDFNDAVKAKSFAKFHTGLAKPFREQFTPEKLQETFQQFIDKELDIAAIATLEPTFAAAPTVDESEVMAVSGSYPTTPVKVHFALKYHFEGGQWKVLGINVELK